MVSLDLGRARQRDLQPNIIGGGYAVAAQQWAFEAWGARLLGDLAGAGRLAVQVPSCTRIVGFQPLSTRRSATVAWIASHGARHGVGFAWFSASRRLIGDLTDAGAWPDRRRGAAPPFRARSSSTSVACGGVGAGEKSIRAPRALSEVPRAVRLLLLVGSGVRTARRATRLGRQKNPLKVSTVGVGGHGRFRLVAGARPEKLWGRWTRVN